MDEEKELWTENYQIYKEIDMQYHRLASHYGMSDSELSVIYSLYVHKNDLSQQDIVNEWTYSKQTINSAIRTLEQKGLAGTVTDEKNKRRKIIVLTEKGRISAEEFMPELLELEDKSFGCIDSRLIDAFNESIRGALEVFKDQVNEICMDRDRGGRS